MVASRTSGMKFSTGEPMNIHEMSVPELSKAAHDLARSRRSEAAPN